MPGSKVPEEQRRAQILAAAFEVAKTSGLSSVTVRSVASQAGVSVGLVLFHFQSMDDLHVALLDWLLTHVLAVNPLPESAPSDPSERLLAILAQQLIEAREEQAAVELFLMYWLMSANQPMLRERIQASLLNYYAAIHGLVSEWYATLERPALPSPDAFALVITALIDGYALRAIHDPASDDPAKIMAVLRLLITGKG